MRTPSRFLVVALGLGSLNGNAVAPKAMRWWLDVLCLSAAWASGESVARSEVWVGLGVGLRRSFWIGSVVRRLDVRMRLRFWRLRTLDC